ncbi:MAG: exodeoxyribonuclease VII large subunit [Leptotrichiaceae bacterium]|nr:exodeoxyribonuclease VII large subunit [Leptotrichiaceae bacterium]MBP6281592.1 exodeoxyribonuclease VII large subunit [Leptotrichiaceae bacterium]MBP7100734.1 exodeoxyribonuclease VII large subunit [Leptotrichiaceae bacterium]MBP7725180.1 exodeoxyribonuclease VII large subunit [Leptotrichiaceae bacterium]MBP9629137.1 exodeoxyribonuclease VII large subunit [Leptotrichiaceae bacterium]
MQATIFSVSEVNRAIKQFIEGTQTFKNIFIQGELSNITYYKSGHLYFTLKDDKASVKCAIFKYAFKNVPNDLKEGDQVKIMGSATIYESNGSYQIIAETLEKTNKLGSLYEKLEQLKKYYFEKGYFNKEYKKEFPVLPMNIGVVTAETGAAIRDIINTTHKRNKNINIYLYPAKVQGEGAAIEVSKGIEFFNRNDIREDLGIDALIIGRGGGSIEDLWAFNEEIVIETIFKSELPIISAVGHEIDHLLSDLVADKRASTPTQAIEILVPEKVSLKKDLFAMENTLNKLLLNKINIIKKELEQRKNNYYIKNYISLLNDKKMDLINIEQRLTRELKRIVEKGRENIEFRKKRFDKINLKQLVEIQREKLLLKEKDINNQIKNKLKILKKELEYRSVKISKYSINDILKQGYTLTRKNGKIVKRGIELSKKDDLEIQFLDVKIKTTVK